VSAPAPEFGGLRPPGEPSLVARGAVGRELFVRYARKDGRSVAMLRAVDVGDSCTVEAEVFSPAGAGLRPGPYVFRTAGEATAFVTEALEALMYLGCSVSAE
jgi:hypothetical protein